MTRLICLTLCLLTIVPVLNLPAQAGIDKKLVEIDQAERERLEKERIAMQEAYEEEARKQAEERRIAEEKRLAEERAEQRQRDLVSLAKNLRENEIDRLNSEIANFLAGSANATVTSTCSAGWFCRIISIITAPFRAVYHVVR